MNARFLNKNLFVILALCGFAIAVSTGSARSQDIYVPNFWDSNERYVRPDLGSLPRLRFLTTTDFPPFNFIDRRKRLSGFHVDLARAICVELEIIPKCQIQALPWSDLEFALVSGDGEALIAGTAITPETRAKYDFSHSYLRIPGRFIQRNETGLVEPLFESLADKTVGVVAGSGHAQYFDTFFTGRSVQSFPTRQLAYNALKAGELDAVFTDALSASFWLASVNAGDCCRFAGGPYISDKYFGYGMAIAVPKARTDLVTGLNFALKAINEKGIFRELYLKYFPLGLF